MKKVRVVIFGRVQGVGFRNWVKRGMKKHKVEGRVWNNDDGTVGAEFEGEAEELEMMMERCKKGSPLARVGGVRLLKSAKIS
jgi:acylphosphatase